MTGFGGPSMTRPVSDLTDVAGMSFEAALARLETIVRQLETGDASLEASIDMYTEGQALKAHCEAKLADAQAKIERIQVGSDGQATGTRPFDGEAVPVAKKPAFNDLDDDVPF